MGVHKNARIVPTGSLTTYDTLYTCPSNTTAVVGSIMIANRGDSTTPADVVRVAFSSTTTPSDEDFIAYDVKIPNLETTVISAPMSLAASNKILVSANSTDISFTANVFEV